MNSTSPKRRSNPINLKKRSTGSSSTKKTLNYKNFSPSALKTRAGRSLRAGSSSSALGKPPKGRVKKALGYAHPKRFFKFLFSKEGLYFSLKAAGIAILLLGLFIFGLFAYYRKDLNKLKPEEIAARIQNSGVKFYDRTGQVLLWEQKGQKDRTVIESDQISDTIKQATIALEDRNFQKHRGFDPKGLLRAALRNSSSGNATSQGGSTIKQQLVKNELLSTEKSI